MGGACLREKKKESPETSDNNTKSVQSKSKTEGSGVKRSRRNTTIRKSFISGSSTYLINDEGISDSYQFLQVLGKGYFGVVKKALMKNDPNKYYAIKTIDKSKMPSKSLRTLSREIEVLANLDHPNIVRYYETYNDFSYFYVVTEYCSGGELWDAVKGKGLDEKTAADIMYKLCSAISHCHSKSIVHRDLKLENILLENKDDVRSVKIIDFGLSRKITGTVNSIVGTPYYVAPEVLDGNYDSKCDIWSLGVIMYVMIFGRHPFEAKTKDELFRKIKTEKFTINKNLSEEAKQLLSCLLDKDPTKRPKAEEILKFPWFKEIIQDLTQSEYMIASEILPSLQHYKRPRQFIKFIIKYLVQEINPKDIEDLKKNFLLMDKENTGHVDVTKFETVDSNNQENTKLLQSHELRKFFKRLSTMTEHLKNFNYTSFIGALMRSKNLLNKDILQQVFNRLDVNNLRLINVQGFQTALKRTGKVKPFTEVEQMFEEVGFRKDHQITFEEFSELIDKHII